MAGAVFLSYTSQDAEAARRICAALQAGGIEVWFDQSELRGGDAWDRQIHQQIRDCALFIPVISGRTQARLEGYFRREWRLAVDRTHDMAARLAFLVPVVIDDTSDREAEVPDEFRKVQWTRLPDGVAATAFVERVAALLAARSAPARPVGPQHLAIDPAPIGAHAKAGRNRAWILPLLAVVAIGALAAGYFASHREPVPAPPPVPVPQAAASAPSDIPEKSVAVLPFVNMSSDKEQEYFSDGLSDELIQLLSNVPDLRVPGRTSSFYFKGRNETIDTISKQLKVANLLEGSVRKSGNRLRVTADLVRSDNGYHLWSATYDRDAKDIFKVQDEIAGAVVSALQAKLVPPARVSARRTSSIAAYDLYLLALQLQMRAATVDNIRKAVDALHKAIRLDPMYAAAYAVLAVNESFIADRTGDAATLRQGRADADRAIAIAPDEADGYAVRGYLRGSFDWDWAGAEMDTERAVALNPTDPQIQTAYSTLLAQTGRVAEAIVVARRAVAADPLSNSSWALLGRFLLAHGDLEGAEAATREAVRLYPDNSIPLLQLATVQLCRSQPTEALKTLGAVQDGGLDYYLVAAVQHSLGHARESQQVLDEVIARHAQVEAYQIAQVYAWRGDKDQAFEWLQRAYRQRDAGLGSLKFDPLVASLRGDGRFAALVKRLNLPP